MLFSLDPPFKLSQKPRHASPAVHSQRAATRGLSSPSHGEHTPWVKSVMNTRRNRAWFCQTSSTIKSQAAIGEPVGQERARTQTQEISQEGSDGRSVHHLSWCNQTEIVGGVSSFFLQQQLRHTTHSKEEGDKRRRENGTYRNTYIDGCVVLLRVGKRRGKSDAIRIIRSDGALWFILLFCSVFPCASWDRTLCFVLFFVFCFVFYLAFYLFI